jgi:hypothetical protein
LRNDTLHLSHELAIKRLPDIALRVLNHVLLNLVNALVEELPEVLGIRELLRHKLRETLSLREGLILCGDLRIERNHLALGREGLLDFHNALLVHGVLTLQLGCQTRSRDQAELIIILLPAQARSTVLLSYAQARKIE